MNERKLLYREFIRAADPKSRQLLIMLHGLGDSIEGYRWMPEALNLPSLNYLLVNAPDSYYGGYSWYDFAGDMTPGVARSKQMIFDLLDAQAAEGFPHDQIMLGGFSQGCLMSLESGLRYPHRLAGIIGISGYVCDPKLLLQELPPVAKQQRILVTHGTKDPIIPFEVVRAQMEELKKAGLALEWHEFDKAHTIAGEEELGIIRRFITDGFDKAKV